MKFKRTLDGRNFHVTFYFLGIPIKTYNFELTRMGSAFVATDTKLNGYYMAYWAYVGHGRTFYIPTKTRPR